MNAKTNKIFKGFKRWNTTYSCAIGDCKKLPEGKRTFRTFKELDEHLHKEHPQPAEYIPILWQKNWRKKMDKHLRDIGLKG